LKINKKVKKNNNIIFLIGFMGSGKTTLGKSLAEKLNYSFIDSDNWIEKKMNHSVMEIFGKYGEEYFRELEYEFVSFSKSLNKAVIATGGGLPCYNGLINELVKIGLVIYLKASDKTLNERLKNDKSRPLLSTSNSEEKAIVISKKLSEREISYNLAHFTIDATKTTQEQINEIQCHLI
jgi:shikimate kinase